MIKRISVSSKILLVSLVSLLVCSTSGFLLWQSVREHENALISANRQLLANTRSLAEHANQSLGEAERALRDISDEIAVQGGIGRLSEQQLHTVMKQRLSGMRQVASALVAGKQGQGIANSKVFPLKGVRVADREYFHHHLAAPNQDVYVGRPVKSKVLDTWVFTLSRRLSNPDGSFAGVVVVSFRVAYFDQFYQSVAFHETLQTMLVRMDGWPLAIAPADERAYQVNIADKKMLHAMVPKQEFGILRNENALTDDQDRHIAFARLGKPFDQLVAVVSLPREIVLADWKRQMLINVTGAFFLMSASVLLAFVLLRHIRELESSEAAISRLNERLTMATEAAGMGVWDWDIVNNELHWDKQMYALYGFDQKETTENYRHWKSMVFSDDLENTEGVLNDLLYSTMPSADLEFRIVRPDTGQLRHMRALARVYHAADGQSIRIVGITYDITARKQSEIEYRTIISTTKDGFWINDMHGRILDVNNAFCALIGYTRDELLTMSIADIEALERPEETRAHIEKILNCGYERFETQHRHKNGALLDVEISANYLEVADGRLVVFVRDIRERRQAEQTVAQALQSAESANIAKSRFLANVSHEIRTPLNAIVGMTHLLAQGVMSDKQREQLGTVESASRTLLAIINDLLDISRIEAGKMELELTNFSLSRLLSEQLSMQRGRATEKGLNLSSHVAPDLSDQLLGDPLRLGQVLSNLLSNAIKFTERGAVSLEVCQAGMRDDELLVCFMVKDTGIGIPPDRQAEIFTPFTQSDNTIARRFGGTGLGLAISSQLVKLMGGEIHIESEEGKGSQFSFAVPLKPLADMRAIANCEVSEPQPESESCQVSSASSLWSQIEERQFRMLVKELERQLRRQNMGALNLFRRLKTLLKGRSMEEIVEMETLLDRLEFSAALSCLHSLAEKFEIPYGDKS